MTRTTYDVARRGSHCAASGVPLKPGDRYVAALCYPASEDAAGSAGASAGAGGEGAAAAGADEALQRLDYSHESWESGARPARLMAMWRGVVPDERAGEGPKLNTGELLSLFESLSDATDERRVALRLVLALLLVRKRLLVVVGRSQALSAGRGGGPGAMLVRVRADGPEAEPIEVAEPDLDEGSLLALSQELGMVLGLGS